MTLMLAANRTTTVFLRRYKVLQWSFIIYRVSLFSGIGIKTAKIDSMFVAIDKSRCQIRPDAIENDIGYIVAIVIEMKTLCRDQSADSILTLSKHFHVDPSSMPYSFIAI